MANVALKADGSLVVWGYANYGGDESAVASQLTGNVINVFQSDRAFAALKPGGVVHVLDMMTDASHTQPRFSAMFAVNMALTTENGWVFSDREVEQWLREAGFERIETRPLPPPAPHWLTRAYRP